MTDIHSTVSEFIGKLLCEHGYDQKIDDDDSLILSGRLDSLAVINIVVFLEQQFNINFSDIYFDQSNFDSINKILEFIQEYQPVDPGNLSH